MVALLAKHAHKVTSRAIVLPDFLAGPLVTLARDTDLDVFTTI